MVKIHNDTTKRNVFSFNKEELEELKNGNEICINLGYKEISFVIEVDKHGRGDFNWSLGHKFIEESLLASYDYVVQTDIKLSLNALFTIAWQSSNVPRTSRAVIFSPTQPRAAMTVFSLFGRQAE